MPEIRACKKGTVKRVGEIISPILKKSGIEEGVRLDMIKARWDGLFNPPLSFHLYPFRLKDGVLLINVDSPVWLQEVSLHKEDFLKLLKPFGPKDVRFRLGRVRFRKQDPGRGNDKKFRKPLSPKTITYIDEAIAPVKDHELKEIIRHAMEMSLCRILNDSC